MKQILLSVTLAAFSGFAIAAPSFAGKWTSAGQPCNDPDGTNQVTIRGKILQWYEQRCEVSNARNLGSSTRYDAKCSGEGETWRDILTLSLSGGKLRIHQKSDGKTDTYTNCSSPAGAKSKP